VCFLSLFLAESQQPHKAIATYSLGLKHEHTQEQYISGGSPLSSVKICGTGRIFMSRPSAARILPS
jgi:hypothetical protein